MTNYRMKTPSILILLAMVIGFMASAESSAQTCRVNSGVNSDGQISYMEVFEYDFVEEKPMFPGGGTELVNFINKNRRYPAEAYSMGIEGRVTCSFVVNNDGTISHIGIIRGVEPSLNKEAIRIISKMPHWSPGKIGGNAVPVRVICAIPFRK